MKERSPVKCILTVLVFLLTVVQAAGQTFAALKDPQPVFHRFSTSRGLPSSETYCVYQDRQGYVWICTDRGVARYDGYRLKVFSRDDGLTDNVVFKLHEDSRGRIWFVTKNNKLCYYTNGVIRPYAYNAAISKACVNRNNVSKELYVGKDGTVFFFLKGNGYLKIDSRGRVDKSAFHRRKDEVRIHKRDGKYYHAFYYMEAHSVSMETERPVIVLEENGKDVRLQGPTCTVEVRSTVVRGQLFVLTDRQVFLRKGDRLVKAVQETPVYDIYGDGDHLWVAHHAGVTCYVFSPETGKLTYHSRMLEHCAVSGVVRDRSGGLWFSTLNEGVYYAPFPFVRMFTQKQGMGFQNVLAVEGTANNVFAMDSRSMWQQLRFPWKRSDTQHAVRLYMLTSFRGHIYLPFVPPSPEDNRFGQGAILDGFAFSSRDQLFARYSATLYERSPEGKFVGIYRYGINHIKDAIRDDDGRLYIAAPEGVSEIRGGQRHTDRLTDSLFRKEVTDMDWHPVYGVVVATAGSGLYCFKGDKIGARFTTKDGLPDNTVTFVRVDAAGRIWAGTHRGLAVLYHKDGHLRSQRLSARNGLFSEEANDLYIYGDTAWVATKSGVAVVDIPQLMQPVSDALSVESISIPGRNYSGSTTLPELQSGISFIKVLLRTTDFGAAFRPEFRYRIRSDADWVYSTQPEILLTEPSGGDYYLEASYRKSNGDWSRPVMLTRFYIALPFYTRWYFITLIVLAAMGGMYLLFRLRLRQINRRNQLQKTINSLEQKALRAQMNPHFIFNSLNSIQSFLMYDENEKAEKYLLRFARLIRQTLNNSRESYITIEAERETLRGYLELEQMRFKEKFSFAITCSLSADELQWGVPPMLIQPFVENAVLHGFKTMETGGKIEVRFEKLEHQRLLCIVEDNGIGRRATMSAKPEGHKSFGTKITEERLAAFRQKYGDEFSIETIDKEANGAPAGTKVVMHIPVVRPGEYEGADEL